MRATDLLRQQHREARALLGRLAEVPAGDRTACLAKLSAALRGHADLEEELLYPELEDDADFEELVSDAFQEHEEIRGALADLERCPTDDEEFPDLVHALGDIVQHHLRDEEEELLPRVDAAFGHAALAELGARMLLRTEPRAPAAP